MLDKIMRSITIPLTENAREYTPPEILCALPESIGDHERKVIELCNQHRFKFPLSAELMLIAEEANNELYVHERKDRLICQLRKFDLLLYITLDAHSKYNGEQEPTPYINF
tara:strand:+ start:1246 stop:1578 length:333 start_codon:yes stop_codon:yes gene_type:complete